MHVRVKNSMVLEKLTAHSKNFMQTRTHTLAGINFAHPFNCRWRISCRSTGYFQSATQNHLRVLGLILKFWRFQHNQRATGRSSPNCICSSARVISGVIRFEFFDRYHTEGSPRDELPAKLKQHKISNIHGFLAIILKNAAIS